MLGTIRYCIIANRVTTALIAAVLLGFGLGFWLPLIKSWQANDISIFEIVTPASLTVSALVAFVQFLRKIMSLNSQLKRRVDKAMTWQVFWSCIFLLLVPIGTILHLGCLYIMFFSKPTFEAFEEKAWEHPSPFKGVIFAILFLILAGGGAYAGVRGYSVIDAMLMDAGLKSSSGGRKAYRSSSNKKEKSGNPLGFLIEKAGVDLTENQQAALQQVLGEAGNMLTGGGGGSSSPMPTKGKEMDVNTLYKQLKQGKGFEGLSGGGQSASLQPERKEVKRPYAMSTKTTRKRSTKQKSFTDYWDDFIEMFSDPKPKESVKKDGTAESPKIRMDEETVYDKGSGNVYI